MAPLSIAPPQAWLPLNQTSGAGHALVERAVLLMGISRAQYLHAFTLLDIPSKAVFCFFTIESQSRQIGHASLLDFGNNEMMPGLL
jgi:hypothetical protein